VLPASSREPAYCRCVFKPGPLEQLAADEKPPSSWSRSRMSDNYGLLKLLSSCLQYVSYCCRSIDAKVGEPHVSYGGIGMNQNQSKTPNDHSRIASSQRLLSRPLFASGPTLAPATTPISGPLPCRNGFTVHSGINPHPGVMKRVPTTLFRILCGKPP
jgi:hypothetical protein